MSIGDVSDEGVSKESVALALKEFGRLDFAVNNAGIRRGSATPPNALFRIGNA